MAIVNKSSTLAETINGILMAIKRETGCRAVGIRLRSGNDFQYFVQNGFSPDFLLTENTLIVRGQDKEICRDKNGNISLACVGRQALSLSVLNMEELVQEIWREQAAINPDLKMELKNNSLPRAFGDRTLIGQIMFNLLSNAVKFTKNKDAFS